MEIKEKVIKYYNSNNKIVVLVKTHPKSIMKQYEGMISFVSESFFVMTDQNIGRCLIFFSEIIRIKKGGKDGAMS